MHCKNNPKKTYTGLEPSPKGLGYCASGMKENTIMKGRDGNMWIIKNGKWVKNISKEYYKDKLFKKLFKWWQLLAIGDLIAIYRNGRIKKISSTLDTLRARAIDIRYKWGKLDEDSNVICIIWSAQSADVLLSFISYLAKKSTLKKLHELVQMKNLPKYLTENYKKYFVKYKFVGVKDYILKY